jgi:hypothetical protein
VFRKIRKGFSRYHSLSLAGCTLRSDPHPDCLADHLRARRFGAPDQDLIAAERPAWRCSPRSAAPRRHPVYGWLTEGFDTLDLKGAKALLDALA